MDKNTLLDAIRSAAAKGEISREELLAAYSQSASDSQSAVSGPGSETAKRHLNFFEAIQYLGAGVVFIGIAWFVGNGWHGFNEFTRIMVTFGPAIVAFAIGVVLMQREQTSRLAYAFLIISILLMPIGVFSIFDAAGVQFLTTGPVVVLELCIVAIYAAAYYALKSRLYIAPIAISLTTLFFSITSLLAGPLQDPAGTTFTEYRLLVIGLSFILAGYYYMLRRDRLYTALFYVFGMILALSAAISLGGFNQFKTPGEGFWEIFFPILTFLAMYFSVFVRQTKILVISALFLMGYVLKISGEYFSTSNYGWALAIVIAGLLMIGVGYFSVYLNRKYIRHTAA